MAGDVAVGFCSSFSSSGRRQQFSFWHFMNGQTQAGCLKTPGELPLPLLSIKDTA